MKANERRPHRPKRRARAAGVLLAAIVIASSGACAPEESCDCSCTEAGKVCASSTEGRTGCGMTFLSGLCSPSGCCNYCCDA